MRKLFIIITVFTFFIPFLFSSDNESFYSYSYARLSYVKGDVFVQRAQDMGYEEGTVNLPVIEGDKLGTREGRAEIHFGKKNYLRADKDTQVDFVSFPRRGYNQIKINLLSGSIILRINFLEREKDFEVHTPDASFYFLDEGLYRLDVIENRETELLVYDGAVEAAGEKGSLLVERGERLVASNGSLGSDPTVFYPGEKDSFYSWSEYRDSLLNRRVVRTYLPDELYEYEVELAYNGRWVYEQPYGYVWVPYVYHNEWRPYYNGRWVWYPIIDWTWVPYDLWGWSVFHYGRWHWRTGLGWYWIPTRVWGPAWVQWYYGYNYVGWSPLSYYGYPVVVINNYFYGRYYSQYYPTHSRALVVIHKNQLQARQISRVALGQSQVRTLGKISLSSRNPGIKPAFKRVSSNNAASRVLSRSGVRKVGKSYTPQKGILSPTRLRSSSSRSSSRVSQSRISSSRSHLQSRSYVKSSTSKYNLQEAQRVRSVTSISKSQSSNRVNAGIKIYPSKRASSSSYSDSLSSARSRSYFLPKSRSVLSTDGYQSRSGIRIYPSRKDSSSLRSTYSRSSSSRYTTSQNSSSSFSRSHSYYSPSRSYSLPSRIYSPSNSSGYVSSQRSSVSSSTGYRYSIPSRSYSYSNKSYSGSTSPGYISPRNSYSFSSRSYSSSTPSRSYSSPSRSYSPSGSSKSVSSRSSSSSSRSISKSSSSRSRARRK